MIPVPSGIQVWLATGNVIDTHSENVAGTQTETRQKKQDGFVANAVRLREVAWGDQPFDIGGRKITRPRRQSPLRDDRHSPIEPWATQAVR